MVCPYCLFPLISGKPKSGNGVVSDMVSCTHCKAILRIELTTLKEPDEERFRPKKEVTHE